MSGVCAVIATYNEAATIGILLEHLAPWPVIVVDDSSPDGTAEIAKQHDNADVIVRGQKYGIASAYHAGLHQALKTGAEFVVQMDAGGTHDPLDARRMHGRGLAGAGLVIGSRFLYGYQVQGRRTAISLGAAWLMRRLGVNVRDATSGFRCWRADVLQAAIAKPFSARGFAFQLEALHRAHKTGAAIAEVAIPYRLTNSSFRPAMLAEALAIYADLWRNNG